MLEAFKLLLGMGLVLWLEMVVCIRRVAQAKVPFLSLRFSPDCSVSPVHYRFFPKGFAFPPTVSFSPSFSPTFSPEAGFSPKTSTVFPQNQCFSPSTTAFSPSLFPKNGFFPKFECKRRGLFGVLRNGVEKAFAP